MSALLPFCALTFCALVLILVFRTVKSEFAFLVALAAGIMCALFALNYYTSVFSFFRELCEETAYASTFVLLLKALGVGLLTGALAETCRDLGQGTLAKGAELVGKGAMIALCFPILEEFTGLIQQTLGAAS